MGVRVWGKGMGLGLGLGLGVGLGVHLTLNVRPGRVHVVHDAEATRVNTPHGERMAVGVHRGRVPEG